MDWITILILILIVGAVGWFLGKSLWGAKNAMAAGVVFMLIAAGGLWYYGEFPEAETPAATAGVVSQFSIDLGVNGTADTFDNTSVDEGAGVFTTPFGRNTTAHSMRTTDSTLTAGGAAFHDPIYNFTVTPQPTAGVTADDLVTIKFSATDPGECITSSGTDYRLIAEDSDSKPYLYWRAVKDDGTYIGGTQVESGSVTFLYTETVYLWLMVVYQDSGCSRIDDFDTESFRVTLSNIDGSWSDTYTIQVMPVVNHA